MINNQTKIYISASSKPGNFGATLYNYLFREYKINAVYIPRMAGEAGELISSIKALGIDGCSVSMPLKESVIEFLDEADPTSISTLAVNTILNNNGVLQGFNTDFYGLGKIFTEVKPNSVLIYGSGALARSAVHALKLLPSPQIAITARNSERAKLVASRFNIEFITQKEAINSKFD